MKRIKMVIEYDGSNYHGFQIQKNAHTIQAEIEQKIYHLTGEKTTIKGASRTDAGVHATGQVIAFDTESTIPPAKWSFALNSLLPRDIRVIKSTATSPEFHPRFDALKKRYSYYIYQSDIGKTFCKEYSLCITEKLDLNAISQGCKILKGKRNYKSFCASGSSAKNYEREINFCRANKKGHFVKIEIEADGFLYNMVRIIVGTLLEIGQGKYSPENLEKIIQQANRAFAGPTAPPQGLFLTRVFYR